MKNLGWYISAFLLIVVALQWCNRVNIEKPVVESMVTTSDSLGGDESFTTTFSEPEPVEKDTFFLPRPYPVYEDTGSTKYVIIDVDTTKIIEDYFTKYTYSDTLIDTTSYHAIITDVLWKNRIISRQFDFKNLRETVINTTVQTIVTNPVKLKFFVGAHLGADQTTIQDVGLDVALLTKKNHLVRASNNLLLEQPNVLVGGYLYVDFSKLFNRKKQ